MRGRRQRQDRGSGSRYVSLPLTGPRGDAGRDAADGVRLALEQAQGKAGPIEVRAHFLDDAKGKPWDPVAVGANARQAVQDSSAAAYIGELDSEPTRASVPITNDAGLVQVSPGAGGVDLTQLRGRLLEFTRPLPAVRLAQLRSDRPGGRRGRRRRRQLGVGARCHQAAATSDGSAFQNLAASEFKSAATEHGIQVMPGKPPAAVAVAADAGKQAVYEPETQRLTLYGSPRPATYSVSAELDPKPPPRKGFGPRFARRYHRAPGPYAAYGYEAMGSGAAGDPRCGDRCFLIPRQRPQRRLRRPP